MYHIKADKRSQKSAELISGALSSFSAQPEPDVRARSIAFIAHWMEHQDLLDCIVSCGRLDILYASHEKYLGEAIAGVRSAASHGQAMDSWLCALCTAQLTAIMVGTLAAWSRHGRPGTAETLYDDMVRCTQVVREIIC